MPQIIEVPSYGDVEFPDGMDDAQIAAAIQQNMGQPNVPHGTAAPQQSASGGERFGAAVLEGVAGVGQMLARGSTIGKIANYVLPQSMRPDTVARDVGQRLSDTAPEGFDWNRLAGNAIPALASLPAGGAMQTGLKGGKAMLQLARQGAVTGGVSGGIAPVQDTDNYAQTKAAQVGLGTVAGGAIAPIASAALAPFAGLVNKAVELFKSAGAPKGLEASRLVIEVLRREGVDPQKVGRDWLKQRTEEVQRALQVGGSTDKAALGNEAVLESVGARPFATRGMVTQEPVQFGEELTLRETSPELAARFQGVRNTLGGRLKDIQTATGEATTTPGAGRAALQLLRSVDDAAKLETRQLYEAAEQATGNTVFIKSREPFQKAVEELKRTRNFQDLDPSAKRILSDLGQGKLTIRQAIEDIESLNSRFDPMNRAKNIGLSIVKKHLDKSIDDAATAAGPAYKLARARHSERKLAQEALPALDAAVKDSVSADDFMGRQVYNAPVADVIKLKEFLKRDPKTWNLVKGRVIADLRDAATKDEPGKFLTASYSNKLRELQDSELLGVFFSDAEQAMLQNIGKAGRLLEGPAGVSRTGLGGAARAMNMFGNLLSRFGGKWLGGPIAAGASKASAVVRAQSAMNQAPITNAAPRFLGDEPRNALARGLGAGGAYGGVNALSN